MTRTIKTYSELITLPTFEERYDYLRIGGMVGIETFGSSRFLNQDFYRSKQWRRIRDYVITRDSNNRYPCDLACEDREIEEDRDIRIHHINPISLEDIEEMNDFVLDPEFLITTVEKTHRAIHYGDKNFRPYQMAQRRPNDTCLWKN